MGEVAVQLSGYSTDISTDKFCNLAKTFARFIIFSYTTAFFYVKMSVVHTDSPWDIFFVVN